MKKYLSTILLLAGFLCYQPILGEETGFPDLAESGESRLNTHNERVMGDMIMQKIYGSDFMVSDAVVNEYLSHLAKLFAEKAHLSKQELDFFGVNTPELNAFAFFGGHVAVHSGLILAVNNESELAAVLAHETAHIIQRHLARILAASRQAMPLTMAEILAAAAIGALGSPEAGFHLATAALAGHVQQMINYTREHEQEADRVGIKLLAETHFDPAAMASVFQKMKQHGFHQDTPPEYLLTHPVFDSRIADAQNRASLFPARHVASSLYFELIRARLEIMKNENSSKKVRRLKQNLMSDTSINKTPSQYAYALALVNHGNTKEAIPILKTLVEEHPHEWVLEYGLIEAEDRENQLQTALTRNQTLLKQNPNNYALTLQQANLLLKNKEPNKVIRLLSPQKELHPVDPFLYQMLARAYGATKRLVLLHRSQAEWHFRRGEFKEAFMQLDLALEHTNQDPILVDQINTRKDRMQNVVLQQKELKL
jgi:predicted Zn-dependent protease